MLIQLAEKRKRGLNGSRRVKAEANFSDVALFSLWFNLINFCLPRIGVTTNPEKANNPNTSIADANKLDTGTIDLEEADGAKADRADVKGVEKLGTGKTDPVEANRVETDRAEENRADKPDIRPVDPAEADGADEQGTGTVDLAEPDKAEVDRADKPDTNPMRKTHRDN